MKNNSYYGVRRGWRGKGHSALAIPIRLAVAVLVLVLAGTALASWGQDSAPGPDRPVPRVSVPVPEEAPADDEKPREPPPLTGGGVPLIAIDAGHGGNDSGCSSGDVMEKDLNLAIAQKLKIILEDRGCRVVMTRDADVYVDRERRAEIANDAGAAVLVSVHQNADESGARGMETWYDDGDYGPDNEELARLVQRETAKATGARDRGLRPSSELIVLKNAAMPSCLIECGFATSDEELALLRSEEYQEKIAAGIADGVEWYINPGVEQTAMAAPPLATPDSTAPSGWGLSFREEGKPPETAVSPAYLSQFGAVCLGGADEKKLYLTFDAGYENGYTESILDTLQAHGVSAAFFVTGSYVKSNPGLTRRMGDDGHIVGNHTQNHYDMTALTELPAFEAELKPVEALYKDATGRELRRYYRPPEGRFSEHSLRQADYLGYKTVFWSLAYVDWEQNQPTPQQAFDKLLPRTHSGALILLHCTSKTNAEILDELLTKWEQAGYSFATLDQLFGQAEGGVDLAAGLDTAPAAKVMYLTGMVKQAEALGIFFRAYSE